MEKILKEKILYIIGASFLILSPWIILFITIFLSKGSISDLHPTWSDELGYWHEVLSFSEKGFNFGYYTLNEEAPTLLSFDVHGFGTISAYVPFAKVFGWNYNSIAIANNVYLSLAFLLMVLFVKPSLKKILFITIFCISYMPLILYSSTSMSELLNYALLIIYFSLLYTLIKSESHKKKIFILLLIFCTYISSVRIIYGTLFLPILLEYYKITSFNFKFFKLSGITIIITALLFYINNLFISPFPESFLKNLIASGSVVEFVIALGKHSTENIINYISPFYGKIEEICFRYFMLLIMVLIFWKTELIQTKFRKWNSTYFISFIVLIFFFVINITIYDIFSGCYRVTAPLFFCVILFLTLFNNTLIIKLAITANLITGLLSYALPENRRKYILVKERYTSITINKTVNSINFIENASSPFDNSIIIDEYFDANIILSLPAGIGFSILSHDITDNCKSNYIFSKKELKLNTYKIIKESNKGFLYEKTK
ncbi:MAG: hypothetical protein E6767_11390 [Dysgonomonas sp.]|nr:hypothetical protein [Dysgonomonas sp.]